MLANFIVSLAFIRNNDKYTRTNISYADPEFFQGGGAEIFLVYSRYKHVKSDITVSLVFSFLFYLFIYFCSFFFSFLVCLFNNILFYFLKFKGGGLQPP